MKIQEKYTISEATKFLGFSSRSTINSRTKSNGNNSLSYDIDDNGNKIILASELERVFPDKYKAALNQINNTENALYKNTENVQQNTDENTENTRHLEAKVAMLTEQLEYERNERRREREEAEKREQKAEFREKDLSGKLDKAQLTIERQTYLLQDMREKPPQKPVEVRKGFWATLLGKTG